jgi:hypothetical protein
MRAPFLRPRYASIALIVLLLHANVSAAQAVSESQVTSGVLSSALSRALAAERSSMTTTTQAGAGDGWNIGIYPVFVWIPSGIDIDVELPPDSGGSAGSIVDGRFDGAYLGGIYASKDWFRMDLDGVWAGIGGDRIETPALRVDADLIYFHATGGVRLAPALYATAGIRRLALKYDIELAGFPQFERKPGIWDPVVGIGYHAEGEGHPFEVHATFEAGGFGAGSDVEYALLGRLDWKPIRHFGLTGGYHLLYLKFTDTLANRDFTIKQTVHGPVFGIGVYF